MWGACPAPETETALCQLVDAVGLAFSSMQWPTVLEHLPAKKASLCQKPHAESLCCTAAKKSSLKDLLQPPSFSIVLLHKWAKKMKNHRPLDKQSE